MDESWRKKRLMKRQSNKEEKKMNRGRENSGFETHYYVKLNGKLKSANWRMTHTRNLKEKSKCSLPALQHKKGPLARTYIIIKIQYYITT